MRASVWWARAAGPGGPLRSAGRRVHHGGREAQAGTAAPRRATVLVFALTRPRRDPGESVPWIARPDVRVVGDGIQAGALRSDDTEARNDILGCFGRSDRSAQSRWIRPGQSHHPPCWESREEVG